MPSPSPKLLFPMHTGVLAVNHPDVHAVHSLVRRGLKQCPLLEEVMSLSQLRGATAPNSPKGSGPHSSWASCPSFPLQDILASRESSELTKPLQITFIPSLMCLLCPKSEQGADKGCCPSAELQHKKPTLAFPPPREDVNDISRNVASAVVDQRCKLLKKWLCHLQL